MSVRYDETKILHFSLLKFAFFRLEKKHVLSEPLEDKLRDAAVLLKGLGIDEDVVQVHAHAPVHAEVSEDVIHHSLEGCRTVSKAKKHDKRFK